jgi:magnesium chelatase accessory protein
MPQRLSFDIDGRDWPNRDISRQVRAGGISWLVQGGGSGPTLLLLHGTGASTHSWRALIPLLLPSFRIIAPDLPGHGFTDPIARPALPAMARAVGDLLTALDARPDLVIGHSAGAAILIRMAIDGLIDPRAIVSLNGALLPIGGVAGQIMSPMAKLLASNPFVPRMFAWQLSGPGAVDRLLGDTGSRLDREGRELYGRLARSPGHVAGALSMMANWDLASFARTLPSLRTPLVLVYGTRDRTISPEQAFEVRDRVRGTELIPMQGLGHLAHEEQPAATASLITRIAAQHGLVASAKATGDAAGANEASSSP